MLLFVIEMFRTARDLAIALIDATIGFKRKRYEYTTIIRSGSDKVWQAITAKTITFGSVIPVRMTCEPVPNTENVFRTKIDNVKIDNVEIDNVDQVMTWRQTLRREGQALHCEILTDGTNPELLCGADDRVSYELAETTEGTRLTLFREVTPRSVKDALLAPFGLRSAARKYKKQIEKELDLKRPLVQRLTSFGIGLSILAFASFWYMMGFEVAALLAVVILLHELGHALAFRLVGMQPKGIYLVPFMGGLATAKTPFRTDFQEGFVSLMGPGFSLVPTFVFLIGYHASGNFTLYTAAAISAFVNLLNLAPILPLDGGRVIKTVLTAVSRRLALIVSCVGVPFGLLGAWWLNDYVFGGLVLIVAIGLWGSVKTGDAADDQTVPMSRLSAAILLAGFIVTAAGHGYAGYSDYSAYQKSASAGAAATWEERAQQLYSPDMSWPYAKNTIHAAQIVMSSRMSEATANSANRIRTLLMSA
jgi:Zn-dependent protease